MGVEDILNYGGILTTCKVLLSHGVTIRTDSVSHPILSSFNNFFNNSDLKWHCWHLTDPSSHKSDQQQISPNNITAKSNVQVKRINEMILTDKMP